jgi:hypothetical protein
MGATDRGFLIFGGENPASGFRDHYHNYRDHLSTGEQPFSREDRQPAIDRPAIIFASKPPARRSLGFQLRLTVEMHR